METDWFRDKMKAAGVTSHDVALAAGRARTGVSHLLNGKQRMSMTWARAFARVLDLPIEEVMQRAGLLATGEVVVQPRGFSDGDATIFHGSARQDVEMKRVAAVFGGDRPGIDVWTIGSPALSLMGFMTGDYVLVDTHQAERVVGGDVVVAQVYGRNGDAHTVLRRFEPPVLVAASPVPEDRRVHLVDGNNVVIRGKVVASWRS